MNEKRATLQELPDKSQISGKRQRTLLSEIKKKKSEKIKTFQELLKQIKQSPQYNQNSQGLSSRGYVYEESDQELVISGNTGTISK